jgi:aldehyde:ferredoxin oxidoreductase
MIFRVFLFSDKEECFMPNGYMGKILWVDLNNALTNDPAKIFKEEKIDDEIYQKFLGGYGLASKIIFDNQKPGVDPLSPENIFCIISGLLSNIHPVLFNGRFMVACKSPLTGTWGDSNCGGHFGPAIKATGYDGIFFTGKSPEPVYLLIDSDKKEIIKAGELWGKKDADETEDYLKEKHKGNENTDVQVACIGKAGETLSLMAGVVNDGGRLAARQGLGAVMGSKNLKALCLRGDKKPDIKDIDAVKKAFDHYMVDFNKKGCTLLIKFFGWMLNQPLFSGLIRFLTKHGWLNQPDGFNHYLMHTWGTCGITSMAANTGDSPVKNWMGVGPEDFPPRKARRISNNFVTKYESEKFHCADCALQCGAYLKTKKFEKTHKPEYETLCGFGTMLLCDDVHMIIEVNDMCNRAGMDTISCSVVVAWAFEAYEKGIITSKDTDLALEWGNSDAVVKLVRQIIDGDGIGKYLRNGVKAAAKHFSYTCEKMTMEVGGQELPMHDSRQPGSGLGLGVGYEVEPTPGRHTSTLDVCAMYRQQDSTNQSVKVKKKKTKGKKQIKLHAFKHKVPDNEVTEEKDLGKQLKDASCFMDIVNGFGLCAFAWNVEGTPPIFDWANGATGWDYTFDEYLTIGQRIKTMRHAFNLRENRNYFKFRLPNRARGVPPLKKGLNAGIAYDFDKAERCYFQAMGYDPETGMPLKETLQTLGLKEVEKALYGD